MAFNGNKGGDCWKSGGTPSNTNNPSGFGNWRRGYDSRRGNSSSYGGYYQSGGSGGYDYNTNPEWFSNDSYGDDDGYGGDGGYADDFYLSNPYRGRDDFCGGRGYGGRPGYNPYVWQKGMPRGRGGLQQTQNFKPKWTAFMKPPPTTPAQSSAKAEKRRKWKEQRVLKFKEIMLLKNKYRSVRQNKHISADDHLPLVLLKRVAYDMCEGDLMVHCLIFSKFASRHPNALKLFTYEAKTKLDEKWDPSVEENKEKRAKYLKETKDDILDGYKKVFKTRATPEDLEAKEKKLDHYLNIISGENFTEKDIPTKEDYLYKKDHSRLEEDFVNDFRYDFGFNAFEVFQFKPNEYNTRTKDIAKRIRFYLDNNPTIAFLLVESVRAKTLIKVLPELVGTYFFQHNDVHKAKNESLLNDVHNLCQKKNEILTTPITKYIAVENSDTQLVRDFADCILMFDKFATFIRYRLLNYTPHILLPLEMKQSLLNELIDKVYRDALNILTKGERMDTFEFVDLEKDEGMEEATEEVKKQEKESDSENEEMAE